MLIFAAENNIISMRKSIITLCLIICTAVAWAVPANRKVITVTQPDGTTVSIRLLGDEYLHFNTTADGYSVVKDARGYYVYAELDAQQQLKPTTVVAHDAVDRKVAELHYLSGVKKHLTPAMTAAARAEFQAEQQRQLRARRAARNRAKDYSNFKGLVVLIEYNDKQFSREDYKDLITEMINKENYDGYVDTKGKKQQFTGSVRDYYYDNSMGVFNPQFDVVGPYQVNFSQYDGNKKYVQILNAALTMADSDVNFKDYDLDGNGFVDLVYFIVAGYGSNYSGNSGDLWWPHRSVVYNPNTQSYLRKDGVTLYDYASSVEMYGWIDTPSTIKLDGIGTICHEFSHVLGLPDFYDADYTGSGGESVTPDTWSIMAGGSYLNDSRTPVSYTAFEREMIGFATPDVIQGEGSYSLSDLSTSNKSFVIKSDDKNEFFTLENRQHSKWDAYLPGTGMLVFRVDLSDQNVWEANAVNNDPSHNYYELLRAKGPHLTDGITISLASDPYPGTGKVTSLNNSTSPSNLVSWSKKTTQWGLENIRESDGVITFDVVDQYELKAIALPAEITVHVGGSYQIAPTLTPYSATPSLAWKSDNGSIATISASGVVKGVSIGSTTIHVMANGKLEAQCKVIVDELPIVSDIATLRTLPDNELTGLRLNNAQVLYANGSDYYLRDASSVVLLTLDNLNASTNDLLNGVFAGTYSVSNGLHQISADQSIDNVANIQVSAGQEAQPWLKAIADVSESDFGQLITLQNAKMKSATYDGLSGIYATSGTNYVRIYNTFNIKMSMPTDYKTKPYDVTGILLPRVSGSKVIKELAFIKEFAPGGSSDIVTLRTDASSTEQLFTLDGRRVQGIVTPGIYLIRKNGVTRKVMVK